MEAGEAELVAPRSGPEQDRRRIGADAGGQGERRRRADGDSDRGGERGGRDRGELMGEARRKFEAGSEQAAAPGRAHAMGREDRNRGPGDSERRYQKQGRRDPDADADEGHPQPEARAQIDEDEVADAEGRLHRLGDREDRHRRISRLEAGPHPVEQRAADDHDGEQIGQLEDEDQPGGGRQRLRARAGAARGQALRDQGDEQAVEALPDLPERRHDLPSHSVQPRRRLAEQDSDQIEVRPHVEAVDQVGGRVARRPPQDPGEHARRGPVAEQSESTEPPAGAENRISEGGEGPAPIADDEPFRFPSEQPGRAAAGEERPGLDHAPRHHLVANRLLPAGRRQEQVEQGLARRHRRQQDQGRGGGRSQHRRRDEERGRHHQRGQRQAGPGDQQGEVDQPMGGRPGRRAAAVLEQLEGGLLRAEGAGIDDQLDGRDRDRIGSERGRPEQPRRRQQEQQPRGESEREAGGARLGAADDQTFATLRQSCSIR